MGLDDDLLVDTAPTVSDLTSTQDVHTEMHIDEEGRPNFPPSKDGEILSSVESRKVPVPVHRMSPLKSTWPKIYPPLVSHLNLQVRMNIKGKAVELRTSKHTSDAGALQKGEDFVVCSHRALSQSLPLSILWLS